MNLSRALRIRRKDVIALVGGGGKTSAMFRLGDELAGQGWRVVCTTSTHISANQVAQAGSSVILPHHLTDQPSDEQTNKSAQWVNQLRTHTPTLLVGEIDPHTDKATGLGPDFIDRIAAISDVDAVIVEADGARTLPFKAPADHEPVIPPSTTLVVPMVGIDVVGQPLSPTYVHRPEQIATLTNAELDQPITVEHVATVLSHPAGGLKNAPPQARLVAMINKVETETQAELAGRLAGQLLVTPIIESVAIGAVQHADPIQRVKSRVAVVVLAAGESRRFGQLKQLLPWGDEGGTMLTHSVNVALASLASQVVVVLGCQAEACRNALSSSKGAALSPSKSAALSPSQNTVLSPSQGSVLSPSKDAALAVRPVDIVVNPDWARGQSTSVRAGLAALMENGGAVIFHLADQPGVTPAVIDALIARYEETLAPVVWPEYQGQRGNPVLFDRVTFPQLQELTGDVGGRPVLTAYARADRAERVAVDEPGVLLDIDSPQDLPQE